MESTEETVLLESQVPKDLKDPKVLLDQKEKKDAMANLADPVYKVNKVFKENVVLWDLLV